MDSSYSLGGYNFKSTGKLKTKENITAVNIRYITYDVLGYYMQTLGGLIVEDINSGKSKDLVEGGTWYASGNDVENFLTSVAYVSDVRMESGKIWRYDEELLAKELIKLRLQYLEGIFALSGEKGEKK